MAEEESFVWPSMTIFLSFSIGNISFKGVFATMFISLLYKDIRRALKLACEVLFLLMHGLWLICRGVDVVTKLKTVIQRDSKRKRKTALFLPQRFVPIVLICTWLCHAVAAGHNLMWLMQFHVPHHSEVSVWPWQIVEDYRKFAKDYFVPIYWY